MYVIKPVKVLRIWTDTRDVQKLLHVSYWKRDNRNWHPSRFWSLTIQDGCRQATAFTIMGVDLPYFFGALIEKFDIVRSMKMRYFMGLTAWRSPRNQHHHFQTTNSRSMLNPNWQIHIKFTTALKNMAMIRENKSCFRHEKNLLDFQELLDGVQKTSRGQNPHRLTTSKVPRMQVLHQRRIMGGYKSRTKTTTFQHDAFCHLLLHPKSLFVSPNKKKSCFNLSYVIPSKKKNYHFATRKKKNICTENVHH